MSEQGLWDLTERLSRALLSVGLVVDAENSRVLVDAELSGPDAEPAGDPQVWAALADPGWAGRLAGKVRESLDESGLLQNNEHDEHDEETSAPIDVSLLGRVLAGLGTTVRSAIANHDTDTAADHAMLITNLALAMADRSFAGQAAVGDQDLRDAVEAMRGASAALRARSWVGCLNGPDCADKTGHADDDLELASMLDDDATQVLHALARLN